MNAEFILFCCHAFRMPFPLPALTHFAQTERWGAGILSKHVLRKTANESAYHKPQPAPQERPKRSGRSPQGKLERSGRSPQEKLERSGTSLQGKSQKGV